jgi:alpha-glucosidase
MANERAWWQDAVIYQVVIRSFQDTDGDGIGDLRGLIQRLDYVQALGAGAIWLTPIYPSPWLDGGYDISDFCGIHPRLGTLETFEELVAESRQRGLRLILDWVPNHTSDQHPWFVAARSRRDDPKRNWYVWADPKPDGSPPSNWLSVFGGSAWTLDERTGQYYYHAFLPEQADLNWRSPEIRQAMHETIRCWLARGVGGLRIDAMDMLLEHERLPDNPPNPNFDPSGPADAAVIQQFTRDQPELHAIIAGFRRVAEEFPGTVLLGEAYMSAERLVTYYGTSEQPELHLPLNPLLLRESWQAECLARTINGYLAKLPPHAWPSWSLGNHDMNRLSGRARGKQKRNAALLLLTLRGTPTIYYGDEIGMHDVEVPPELGEDPQGRRQPHRNRDVARTPMQWSDEPQAGFSTGEPYLPVAPDYRKINVAASERDPQSLLYVYRQLTRLRTSDPTLRFGDQSPLEHHGPVLSYRRSTADRGLLVFLNLKPEPSTLDISQRARIVFSTDTQRQLDSVSSPLELRSDEGVILELQ